MSKDDFCSGCGKKIGVWGSVSIFNKNTHEIEHFCDNCHSSPRSYKPEVTAIFTDSKGNDIAVDQRGNVTNNTYVNDPHGWKRAGKKIGDRDVRFV